MKKVFVVFTAIPAGLALLLVLQKVITHSRFGPVAIVMIAAMALLSIFSFFSLRFYDTSRRKLINTAWLTLVQVVVTYLLFDGALGFFLIHRLSPLMVADTHVHHKLQANAYSEMVSLDFDYVQKTNNVGFRGRDIGTDKNPNTFRIFMQGDSFTMGKGVKDDETFSYLLEKSLRAKGIKFQGKDVEVVNGGVDSYAPILEFFQLNGRIDQLKPDLVILNFDMSDLLQEAAYRSSAAVRDAAGLITGIDGTPEFHATLMPDTTWVDHHLYLGRYFLYYLNSLSPEKEVTIQNTVLTGDMELLKHTLVQDDQDRTAQWGNIFDSIQNIKKLCETHNSDFILTTYPWGHQVNDIEWTPGRSSMLPKDARPSDRSVNTLADFAQRSGIDFLNAFPLFRAYKNSATEPLYFKYDMHWRPVGHRMFAEELERYLTEKYRLRITS